MLARLKSLFGITIPFGLNVEACPALLSSTSAFYLTLSVVGFVRAPVGGVV